VFISLVKSSSDSITFRNCLFPNVVPNDVLIEMVLFPHLVQQKFFSFKPFQLKVKLWRKIQHFPLP